jgi:hypothetical protein
MLSTMQQQGGPKRFSDRDLGRLGVQILNPVKVRLRCLRCRAEWMPELVGHKGRLLVGYWKCPNECNVPQES